MTQFIFTQIKGAHIMTQSTTFLSRLAVLSFADDDLYQLYRFLKKTPPLLASSTQQQRIIVQQKKEVRDPFPFFFFYVGDVGWQRALASSPYSNGAPSPPSGRSVSSVPNFPIFQQLVPVGHQEKLCVICVSRSILIINSRCFPPPPSHHNNNKPFSRRDFIH